ncbi:hypothetical protein PP175_29630 (plasmid) [Aneurinibacillus sp. Ricciae_BoGa-3]|uniref:hypothetical protein n=1 Tax=Aneurinibacillus sp. Ricciae_BoGa-3 TaxID=3022697 RepID=UPI0023413A89|nr:hypothetical protein [Aneurinibacillus sp. Ricciae_BoGa-3]WCK57354.1 hypothetical protein PP175_29630 [Aneurinibacillus sp. Ricciae_BoGa-3]
MNEEQEMYTDFLHELQREVQFQQNGGTSYRKDTADVSLSVAQRAGSVIPFFQLVDTKQTISRLFPDIDRYRLDDVAKMLHVIAKDLRLNATLSDDVKAYVQEKRENRKPLSFIKK